MCKKYLRTCTVLYSARYFIRGHQSDDSSRASRDNTTFLRALRAPPASLFYCYDKGWINIPVHAASIRSFPRISMSTESASLFWCHHMIHKIKLKLRKGDREWRSNVPINRERFAFAALCELAPVVTLSYHNSLR